MSWFFNWAEEYDVALSSQEAASAEKHLFGKGHGRTAESMMGLALCHYHLYDSLEAIICATEEASQTV